jgi:hypothetical protein
MMAETITFVCLVHGELSERAFSIKVSKTELVAELKELIKAKKQHAFAEVDADQLTLWRVSIPVDDDAALQNLVLKDNQANGVQKLSPARKISKSFWRSPLTNTLTSSSSRLHLLVSIYAFL